MLCVLFIKMNGELRMQSGKKKRVKKDFFFKLLGVLPACLSVYYLCAEPVE